MRPAYRLLDELRGTNVRLHRVERGLLLEGVPTSRDFSKAATNLLVMDTHSARLPFIVLVDENLDYCGRDPNLRSIFSGRHCSKGWRALILALDKLSKPNLANATRAAICILNPVFRTRPRRPPPSNQRNASNRVLNTDPAEPIAMSLPCGLSLDWQPDGHPAPFVGREDLLQRAEAIVSGPLKPRGVLVSGPSGIGKTAFCRELSNRWQAAGRDHFSVRIDLPALFAGTIVPPERSERVKLLCDEVLRLGPCVLLIAENFQLLTADPLARIALLDALDAGLRLCATTSSCGPRRLGRLSLHQRLDLIELPEPTLDEMTNQILPAWSRVIESESGVTIAPESYRFLIRTSEEVPGAHPGKGLLELKRAVATARRHGLSVLAPDDLLAHEA